MSTRRTAGLLLLVLALAACSKDDPPPTQSKSDQIVGSWYLAATEGDSELASLVTVSYRLDRDGTVRQRLGGPFLRELRQVDIVQQALAGQELGVADAGNAIDGGRLDWTGTWTATADSLHLRFDGVAVEVFGDLPLLGTVSVPVLDEPLTTATAVRYACDLQDETLRLRGTSVAVGIGADGEALTLDGVVPAPVDDLVESALELLAEQLRGVDGQTYVRR